MDVGQLVPGLHLAVDGKGLTADTLGDRKARRVPSARRSRRRIPSGSPKTSFREERVRLLRVLAEAHEGSVAPKLGYEDHRDGARNRTADREGDEPNSPSSSPSRPVPVGSELGSQIHPSDSPGRPASLPGAAHGEREAIAPRGFPEAIGSQALLSLSVANLVYGRRSRRGVRLHRRESGDGDHVLDDRAVRDGSADDRCEAVPADVGSTFWRAFAGASSGVRRE